MADDKHVATTKNHHPLSLECHVVTNTGEEQEGEEEEEEEEAGSTVCSFVVPEDVKDTVLLLSSSLGGQGSPSSTTTTCDDVADGICITITIESSMSRKHNRRIQEEDRNHKIHDTTVPIISQEDHLVLKPMGQQSQRLHIFHPPYSQYGTMVADVLRRRPLDEASIEYCDWLVDLSLAHRYYYYNDDDTGAKHTARTTMDDEQRHQDLFLLRINLFELAIQKYNVADDWMHDPAAADFHAIMGQTKAYMLMGETYYWEVAAASAAAASSAPGSTATKERNDLYLRRAAEQYELAMEVLERCLAMDHHYQKTQNTSGNVVDTDDQDEDLLQVEAEMMDDHSRTTRTTMPFSILDRVSEADYELNKAEVELCLADCRVQMGAIAVLQVTSRVATSTGSSTNHMYAAYGSQAMFGAGTTAGVGGASSGLDVDLYASTIAEASEYYSKAIAVYERYLDWTKTADASDVMEDPITYRIRILRQLSIVLVAYADCWMAGINDIAQSVRYLEQSVESYQELSDIATASLDGDDGFLRDHHDYESIRQEAILGLTQTLQTLADSYLQLGRYANAKTAFRQTLENMQEYPDIVSTANVMPTSTTAATSADSSHLEMVFSMEEDGTFKLVNPNENSAFGTEDASSFDMLGELEQTLRQLQQGRVQRFGMGAVDEAFLVDDLITEAHVHIMIGTIHKQKRDSLGTKLPDDDDDEEDDYDDDHDDDGKDHLALAMHHFQEAQDIMESLLESDLLSNEETAAGSTPPEFEEFFASLGGDSSSSMMGMTMMSQRVMVATMMADLKLQMAWTYQSTQDYGTSFEYYEAALNIYEEITPAGENPLSMMGLGGGGAGAGDDVHDLLANMGGDGGGMLEDWQQLVELVAMANTGNTIHDPRATTTRQGDEEEKEEKPRPNKEELKETIKQRIEERLINLDSLDGLLNFTVKEEL